MESLSNSLHTLGQESALPDTLVDKFISYVCSVCSLLIEADAPELHTILHNTYRNAIVSFLTKTRFPVLFVQRIKVPLDENEEGKNMDEALSAEYTYSIDLMMEFKEDAYGVVFTKRDAKTFSEKMSSASSFSTLLQIVEISNSVNPFEFFRNYISTTFEPYFESIEKKKFKDRKAITSVTESMESLKLALEQCQNKFKIPEINVLNYIHPKIKEIVQDNSNLNDINEVIKGESKILNEMGKNLQECAQLIDKIIQPTEEAMFHSVVQEINYWESMEKALSNLDQQRNHVQVSYTIKVLKENNRKIPVNTWMSLPIDEALKNAKNCASLLKDLPINELLSSKDIDRVTLCIEDIFKQLSKIKNNEFNSTSVSNSYPARGARLVEAISNHVKDKVLEILKQTQLMYLDFEEFERIIAQTYELFTSLEHGVKNFEKISIVIAKKTNTTLSSFTDKLDHQSLRGRLDDIRSFRTNHEQLRSVISKALPPFRDSQGEMNVVEQINKAYEEVRDLNNKALDLSANGAHLWKAAVKHYYERIDLVENYIATIIKDKLGGAKSASEMFRVFSKFNSLFYMPKIKSAITQHQDRLIEKVKEDISKLESKFKKRYTASEAEKMSHLRDLPSVSGAIIWARQIEKQLEMYMKRVESVFGNGWDRLKDMRQFNYFWLLNDKLAEFIGIPFFKLEHKVNNNPVLKMDMKPELKGTAIALAFLELVYPDSMEQWEVLFQESMAALQKEQKKLNISANIYLAAVEMLKEDQHLGTKHFEESNLRQKADRFRSKLRQNISELLDKWNQDVLNKIPKWKIFDISKDGVSVKGFIFEVAKNKNDQLDLLVNFHKDIGVLIKEVRNLTSLEMEKMINVDVKSIIIEACEIYPIAVSLIESVKTYNRVLGLLDDFIKPLAAVEIKIVQTKLSEGFNWPWKAANLETYCKELYEAVSRFQANVSSLIVTNKKIVALLDELRTCKLNRKPFADCIENIQKLVDDIALEETFSNRKHWVKSLNKKIEEILSFRLQELLSIWVQEWNSLLAMKNNNNADAELGTELKVSDTRYHLFNEIGAIPFQIEIKVINRRMRAIPAIQRARAYWISKFNLCISWISDLPMIKDDSFANALASANHSNTFNKLYTFRYLLAIIPQALLQEVYGVIESSMLSSTTYIQQWLQYQVLWDIDMSVVLNQLGSNLHGWMQLLEDVGKAQSLMATTEKEMNMGSVIISFKEVYDQVTAKYGDTLKEILVKFRTELEGEMKILYGTIAKHRSTIESMNLKNNEMIVSFLRLSRDVKRSYKIWEENINMFKKGEQQLLRNNMKLPPGWKYAGNIESEWIALNEIVRRLDDTIKSSKEQIVKEILNKDAELDQNINQFIEKFKKEKPVNGDMLCGDALRIVDALESRLASLQKDLKGICEAREALDLEPGDPHKLDPCIDEISSLKAVWQSLQNIWNELSELGETAFNSVMWRKVKRQLEGLLETIRKLSSWMLSYAAVEHLQETIKLHIQELVLVKELREESMKERHWQELKKNLNTDWILSELTLSHLWEAKILSNEAIVRDILRKAQGEVGLENFLKKVKDTWADSLFDLVNYNNKCILIKSWDDLFKQVSDDLEGLSAMKASQFFKTFEDEANALDQKINKIRITCDVWVDVQRIWVYLEGVFTGNADVRYQLPRETQKFQAINNDFKQLMRKVQANPKVIEVINIPQIVERLEKLNQSLIKIQKSLGEYLEKQRAAFPRFYFIGDEDLLEIIGSGDDPTKIQKHLRKMFAGIASLQMEDGKTITGVASKEGEVIDFKTPVKIEDKQPINVWLANMEKESKISLAYLLQDAITDLSNIFNTDNIDKDMFIRWIGQYPAQLVVLSCQVVWTQAVEIALTRAILSGVKERVKTLLDILAGGVLEDHDFVQRKKYEHLITEFVHQRDVITSLETDAITSAKDFSWLYNMRFYWDEKKSAVTDRLVIQIANASFTYGFEYLGVIERLVQTPLTDRCYLALTQALHSRLGGSPFGPAGTGKTETVKALGAQLGRFVLVFNCDESFDFKAMGRIFVGLCQCGAWGCFDEFNRLEENILSAVSQQIQKIQMALRDRKPNIELLERNINVQDDTGIFITMNPGYAGRSNLPDNLKQLFRNIAMVKPDKELIAQVILYSQGFKLAEVLARKIVLFFTLCFDELSSQSHYDFGLRGLKNVLVNAGYLKRRSNDDSNESNIIIQSIEESMIPKLVGDDVFLLRALLQDLFPGCNPEYAPLTELRAEIETLCQAHHLVYDDKWLEKIIQLYKIQNLQHGLMLVGPSGSGKTSCLKILLQALEKIENIKSNVYFIDPKSLSKDGLYGFLDATTREWTDGVFTHLLRKIIDNLRGESSQRHWIVFDGDVDPEWVENLNSVLDDNKLFTLPNGERLALPPNVRIVFEVKDLKYATLATVSRCGMIWFSEDVVSLSMVIHHFLEVMKNLSLDEDERASMLTGKLKETKLLILQQKTARIIAPYFEHNGFVTKCLEQASTMSHIMDFCRIRTLNTVFALLNKSITRVHDYNLSHSDFPLDDTQLESYMTKRLVYSVVWGFGSSMNMSNRLEFAQYVSSVTTIPIPDDNILDYEVNIEDGRWVSWANKVPQVSVETHKLTSADAMIPTIDTARHEDLLSSWIVDNRSVVLCGPPGSGKTMILTAVLRSLPSYDACFLNFSSATMPELILKTFEQYCEVVNTADGMILQPNQAGKWLVVFCDEINLPANDKYGTQRVITFMRQLIEQGGYWRASDLQWIKLKRIMFVGACNPPTDAGRVPMTERFLRHCPILFVDFPSPASLRQIYGTFNKTLLKLVPSLVSYAEATTNVMVDFFIASQKQFTPDIQPHYIYSPRELSRWIRAMYEALQSVDSIDVVDFVRLLCHEGLRIFADRLTLASERKWTDETIDQITCTHFPVIDNSCLARPILFSNWMHKNYVSVEVEELRSHVAERLKTFSEEELEVKLVLFDSVLEHVLRIDRVLKQPLGHLLLVGVSGAGKTILSRFAAWMNGYSVFQIKAHRNYLLKDFEEDLRKVMRRSGVKGERLVFIFDESNVLTPSFLEYMNALLASGEVPGLFEGEDYTNLMNQCRDSVNTLGLVGIDTEDELYHWFIKQVQRNLHIVFTINPANADFKNRSATSPALFNRCVIDWFGDWSQEALFQVGEAFTKDVHLESIEDKESHMNFVSCLVNCHNSVVEASKKVEVVSGKKNYITPRHYLDFIQHFRNLYIEKRQEVQEQQLHMNIGLKNLTETEEEVSRLQIELRQKEQILIEKKRLGKEKLDIMVENQKDAENKKRVAEALSIQLDQETEVVEKKKQASEAELSEVIPKLERAKSQIRDVPRTTWTTLRNYATPPKPVQKTLELVILILFQKDCKDNWADVKAYVSKADFIQKILTFKPEDINSKMRSKLDQKLDELDPQAVSNASQVCFTMFEWMKAMIEFSQIQQAAEPLRLEVESLREKCEKMKMEHSQMIQTINELEGKIKIYEEEYKLLYQETNLIELEMQSVKAKVERSTSLLMSLASETIRWREQSGSFEKQMETLVGDVLVFAGFLTYGGFFDEYYRNYLHFRWASILDSFNLRYKHNLSLIEFLSTPDERLKWEADKLPTDNISIQNAIIIKRFNRYPLIIDPTGQATEFLMNYYKGSNINRTNFSDASFIKTLESSLRFGTPILIQDAESLDPILNPILNKEVKKIGGRNLVTLGNQDIDLSPAFHMFLVTRDPSHQFEPDLCSRVTFVNFTVTPSSLHSQCLSTILQSERPEIDKQRSEQLKLQGEYKVKLRTLEQKLLDALSEAKGNILENEVLIKTLEGLKQSSIEIAMKVKESDIVMEQMSAISETYNPLASFCSSIYFTLVQLTDLHFLYHFSLELFFEILNSVLSKTKSSGEQGTDSGHIDRLIYNLFSAVFKRVSRSLLHEDKLSFALRLADIRHSVSVDAVSPTEKEFLLKKGHVALSSASFGGNSINLSEIQEHYVKMLDMMESFKDIRQSLQSDIEHWRTFLNDSSGTVSPPIFWKQGSNDAREFFRRAMIVKAFKPEQLVSSLPQFVSAVFDSDFLKVPDLNIAEIVEKESSCFSPLLLCSMPGYDASQMVEQVAVSHKKQYQAIAMGTVEAYEHANKAIATAVRKGTWLMLKNVHLSPSYLIQLEKKLHAIRSDKQLNQDFRIFLTSEVHPNLPVNLLRRSQILLFEPPDGIKAHLSQTFANLSPAAVDKVPVERSRLYLLVAWLHSVIQERLRYQPIGWSKRYEFNQSDLKWAIDTLDKWVDITSSDRSNVQPSQLPWKALHVLLGQSIYGGKIDNEFDQMILKAFLEQLLAPSSYNHDFVFFRGQTTLSPLEGSKYSHFMKWINNLPDNETPEWLCLSNNVSKLTRVKQASTTLMKLLRLQNLHEEEVSFEDEETDGKPESDEDESRPLWIKMLKTSIEAWLQELPENLNTDLCVAGQITNSITNPLFRCFSRELQGASNLLNLIRKDLNELVLVCESQIKITNVHRELIDKLNKGMIPESWKRFTHMDSITVNMWITDFVKRVTQLENVRVCMQKEGHFNQLGIWLGGLLFPEAFLTATRQHVAHKYQVPLESLKLQVKIGASKEELHEDLDNNTSFIINGVHAECAEVNSDSLVLSDELCTPLPSMLFTWVHEKTLDDCSSTQHQMKLPLYLNTSRANLLCTVTAKKDDSTPAMQYYQRGVSLISWM